MSRKPKFKQASFRGVPFQVDTSELEVGRRTIDHEFPQKDVPYTEDLGKKAQNFSLDGYVIGPDYKTARDAVMRACETAGPGELIHPYFGVRKVVCKFCRVKETAAEGGMARLSFVFMEAGELSFPTPKVDILSAVQAAFDDAVASVVQAFSSAFKIADEPSYLLDDASEKFGGALDLVGSAVKAVQGGAQAIADVAYKIRNLKADLRDLVGTPGQLATYISDSLTLLSNAVGGDPKLLAVAYTSFFTFGNSFPIVSESSPERTQQKSNQESIASLMRRLGIVHATLQASQATYESFEEAAALRDSILGALEQELTSTDDYDAYSSLQEIRATLLQSVPPESQALPHLIAYEPFQTVSSLVLAYELYNSLDLETDIVARNKIRHPGFIAGGKEVLVLQDS